MLKTMQLRRQRKARTNVKSMINTKNIHNIRNELYRKLEEDLHTNPNVESSEQNYTVAYEISPDKVAYLIEAIDDDFKLVYDVIQRSSTVFEFKIKELI